MNKVIIIFGPTGVGKSSVAIELAKKINGEIISADSMQIYEDLNIGSAKVTNAEMQGIPHHLINIKKSMENYSVHDFCIDCNNAIKEIKNKNKSPIIVGGTGLYIKALTEGFNYAGVNKNNELRSNLTKLQTNELFDKLTTLNSEEALKIGKGDRRRLIRAIEIILNGGTKKKNGFKEKFLIFGLVADREVLYKKINDRVDIMIKNGMIDEVKYLKNLGATSETQSMRAIGYKEYLDYLSGIKSLAECVDLVKQHTRNYAKRQFTFMNQFPNIIKINVESVNAAVSAILEKIKE